MAAKRRHLCRFIWGRFTQTLFTVELLGRSGEGEERAWYSEMENCVICLYIYVCMYWQNIVIFFAPLLLSESVMTICYPFVSSCILQVGLKCLF